MACHSAESCPPAPDLATALRQLGITFLVGLDRAERTATRYGVTGRPHVVLIGSDGKVLWRGHPEDEAMPGAIDAALEKLPARIEFDASALPREVQPHARAAAEGRFDRAIKPLRKLIDDAATAADVRDAARATLDQIARVGAQRLAAIEELDRQRLYYDVAEAEKASAWLKELPECATRLAALAAARDATAFRDGVKAGERYHRGLANLRNGDAAKAIRDFDYVIAKFEATAYAELARKMKQAAR